MEEMPTGKDKTSKGNRKHPPVKKGEKSKNNSNIDSSCTLSSLEPGMQSTSNLVHDTQINVNTVDLDSGVTSKPAHAVTTYESA